MLASATLQVPELPPNGANPSTSAEPAAVNSRQDVEATPKASQSPLTDQTNLLPKRKIIICFMGLSLCILISQLDTVVVATVLPTITTAFSAGSIVSWVPSAYLLTSTSFVALYGRFSDIFGRKATLTATLCIMMAGNLAAGFSKSIVQLIICRGIAGIGGGAIFSLAQIIMSDVVSLRERGKYQAIIATVSAVGYGVGPVIGGAIAERASWRWCFWFSIPISLCALPVIHLVLPLKPVQGNVKQKLLSVDYIGSASTLIACTFTILPLIWGGVTFPWASPVILSTLISGFFMWFVFFAWEWKGAKLPIVPMYIFGYSTVCGVYIGSAINGLILTSVTFYIPQCFQVALGYSPIHAGLLLMPALIGHVAFNQIAGQIMSRTGHYLILIYVGFIIWSIACGLISLTTSKTHESIMIVLMLFSGIGCGLTGQTMTVAAQASVPRKEMAVVTAFRNFVRMLGSVLSLAIGSALLNNSLRNSMVQLSLPEATVNMIVDSPALISSSGFAGLSSDQLAAILYDGYIQGFRRILILNASLAAFAFLTTVLLVKHVDLTREDEDAHREGPKNIQLSAEAKSGSISTDSGEKV